MAAVEPRRIDVEYQEVECKSALNPVKNMGFSWSLNPYTGLRAPVRFLLRPRIRDARRPALR
jgi:hypothetical protein